MIDVYYEGLLSVNPNKQGSVKRKEEGMKEGERGKGVPLDLHDEKIQDDIPFPTFPLQFARGKFVQGHPSF